MLCPPSFFFCTFFPLFFFLLFSPGTIPTGEACPSDAKLLDDSKDERCLVRSVDARKSSIYVQVYVSLNTYDFQQLVSGVSSPWQLASGCNDKSFLDSSFSDPREWNCAPCPLGAFCEGEVTWPEVIAKFGWWRNPLLSNKTTPPDDVRPEHFFAPCMFPPACQGAANTEEFEEKYSDPIRNSTTGITITVSIHLFCVCFVLGVTNATFSHAHARHCLLFSCCLVPFLFVWYLFFLFGTFSFFFFFRSIRRAPRARRSAIHWRTSQTSACAGHASPTTLWMRTTA